MNDFENNQNGSYDDDYAFRMVTDKGRPKTLLWSIISVVFAVLSILTFYLGYSAIILGLLAAVFAVISRKNLGYFNRMSIAGLSLGIIGFVFGCSVVLAILFGNIDLFDSFFNNSSSNSNFGF